MPTNALTPRYSLFVRLLSRLAEIEKTNPLLPRGRGSEFEPESSSKKQTQGDPQTFRISKMITTHVLDVARGAPAARVPVELDVFITGKGWHQAGRGVTNNDGRIIDFAEPSAPGIYRLMFDLASYMPDPVPQETPKPSRATPRPRST